MSFKSQFLAASAAILMATTAFANGVEVQDPYARSASNMATTGAAFMVIHNHGGPDDRLIGATSEVAARVELHTHREDANGVMRMIHVEEGFDLPSDGEIIMERGGHHVMFMGLNAPLVQGDVIDVTLIFETAGEVVVQVPVDMKRQPGEGAHAGHDHSQEHKHGHSHGTKKD
ncbi:MAG: copper chaperone PCu(A)C [Rhodobacterales bacterium]